MDRRFRRNCGLCFFVSEIWFQKARMAEVAYVQLFTWERSAREVGRTSSVIGKFCVNTEPGMGILSRIWVTCWGGCERGSKEASETSIERASKNKIQDGTTSTLGSLDSPHLRHPRIGKPTCSLPVGNFWKYFFYYFFFLSSVKNLFLSKVSVAAKERSHEKKLLFFWILSKLPPPPPPPNWDNLYTFFWTPKTSI